MRGCCFFGHKDCPREIAFRLSTAIEKLITDDGVTRFYVGTHGSFDRLVYKALCELEKKYADIQVFVVLAYLNRTPQDNDYDMQKTVFPDELTKTPARFAIRQRNAYMLKQADVVIAYLNDPFSNTYRFVETAVKRKKRVINLGNYDITKMLQN